MLVRSVLSVWRAPVVLLALFLGIAPSFASTQQCNDGLDNDNGCTVDRTGDRSGKAGLPACADGDDNDGDGAVDYPDDDGCGSYGDPSEDSEGCTRTGSCVCGSDSDADGLVDVRSEVAICQNLSGRLVCPTDRQQCTQQHVPVWNPSGAGTVEQRQDWVCPAGVESGCGLDPADGRFYCSRHRCVNASAPVVTEHDSAGDWPEERQDLVGADGSCSGEFQIFSGSAKRCRKRGVSTGYQNCCRNRLPPLSDRMGAPGEPNQREYRKQHTAIEVWENQCDPDDQETALLNDSGYCVYLGTYCSKEWKWIGCVQKNKSFCCYNSHLAALVHEQVKTVPDDFGTLKRPNCRGFTPEEFQGLDFSKIDLSAYFDSAGMKSSRKIQDQLRTTVRDSYSP